MPSKHPRDLSKTLASLRFAAPVGRKSFNLGTFTANTTVTGAPRFVVDRPMVIREIWFTTSAIPSDTDGTMLINCKAFDITENADDNLVTGFDTEAVNLVANKAYKATFVAETSENELTVDTGDTIRFELVNNSAAIDTNATVNALIVYQPLKGI